MDTIDHPPPNGAGMTEFITYTPEDFVYERREEHAIDGDEDDEMSLGGGQEANSDDCRTSPGINTNSQHNNRRAICQMGEEEFSLAQDINNFLETALDMVVNFTTVYPQDTVNTLLEPASDLCYQILEHIPSFCRQKTSHNTDPNIAGILNSLSRELWEVKYEIAKINKITNKNTKNAAQEKGSGDQPQDATAESPTNSSHANPSTYAATVAKEAKKVKSISTATKAQMNVPKHERLIVRFQGNPIPAEERPSPLQLVSSMNDMLALRPTAKGLTAIGASWTQTGNCVVTFPANTTSINIKNNAHLINSLISAGRYTVANRDVKWSKVVVHRVLTGTTFDDGRLFSADTLLQQLSRNIHITKLKIMRKPDWI